MKIRNLQDLEVFVAAAEGGGLSAAARALNLSPAVTSAALKRLEASLGVALFVRTTRSMRLTIEGERLLMRAQPVLESLRAAENEAMAQQAVVEGQVQISLPSDLGRNQVLAWLNDFQEKYPGVQLRLHFSDRLANIYRDPVDIAIRFGKLPDSSMVALPLIAENPRLLCASPAYVAARGAPASPEDLKNHNCLCFVLDETVYNRWSFHKAGVTVTVPVQGDRIADDSDVVRRWAMSGHGIAYRSRVDVFSEIAQGRLLHLCADWEGENVPLYLLVAGRRQISAAVRLLHEYLAARCAEMPRPGLPQPSPAPAPLDRAPAYPRG